MIRILSGPRYARSTGSPAAVLPFLRKLTSQPGHRFWADDVSLLDPAWFVEAALLNSAQLTDVYLLALAVRNGGRLATFDRKIRPEAAVGGQAALHVIA
ncbi:hypothetical protein [Phenylobacterium sp.]|uniref:hypothetical protein n=1 Tax=Phenylobacterium sp. TaxID=1871053 RepID=UPI00301D3D62